MLRFMFHKLIHKKWMVLSLLLGNILLIAIAASHPMYKEASLQRMLTDEFEKLFEEKNTYPALITLKSTAERHDNQEFHRVRELSNNICRELGIELYQRMEYFNVVSTKVTSQYERADNYGEFRVIIGALEDMEENINIVSGRINSNEITEDGFIEAVVSQSALVELNVLIGEELTFNNFEDSNGNIIKVRIVGVYEANGVNNDYWVASPENYSSSCMIDNEIFESLFLNPEDPRFNVRAMWYVQPDYRSIQPGQATTILKLLNGYQIKYQSYYSTVSESGFKEILNSFGQNEKKINLTLLILQVPILILLCAFLFMISGQMLSLEQNEISQLKSRGASRKQILLMYFMQAVFLAVISIIIGIPVGSYLCRVLGSSNAFLEFVQRRPLHIFISKDVILYAIAAGIVSIGMSVIPVIKYSGVSIVHLKQRSNRKNKVIWQQYYLDIVLLLTSLYGLNSFNKQKEDLAIKVLQGDSLDPLLFFSSSLFILGAGLLALRIQPFIIRSIFFLLKRVLRPAAYASFLQIIRTVKKQYFIMIFLILTVALGMFNATIARTIVSNAEESIRYSIGADIVLNEVWDSNEAYVQYDPEIELEYKEPDFGRYSQIEGIESAARVYINDKVEVTIKREKVWPKLMAINTKEFGETTDVKSGILTHSYRDYLNAMAKDSNGVLLSMNFKDKYGLNVGDSIYYQNHNKESLYGKIYGFVEYWPSYYPTTSSLLPDGSMKETDNYLIISHLSLVQKLWDLRPYQVWIKAKEDTEFFYDYATENKIKFTKYQDIGDELKDLRNETLFQGTNGILTLSFIVILILCTVGFLIYWILSIHSRELLFGVFRAMGMSRREIVQMLLYEQICVALYSIAVGAGIGHLASKWFVPLIQIAYSATNQVLPLELITNQDDMIKLFSVIGIVFLSCMAILVRIIFKMKIAQALKLGED